MSGNHTVNKVYGVVSPAVGIIKIALNGLQFGHDVLRNRARCLQLYDYGVGKAHGIAQRFSLVEKRLLQLRRKLLERVAVGFVGCFTGNLYRPLLSGDTRSRREAVVCGGEVGNLAALVNQTFQVFSVLLYNLVLDRLVFLSAFLTGFELSHKAVNGLHLLVQFGREIGGGVPRLAHLLGIFRGAVAQSLYSYDDGGEHRQQQSERVCLDYSVEDAQCVCRRADALREGDHGDTNEYYRRAVRHHSGLAYGEYGVPQHRGGLYCHNPAVINGYHGNDIADGLAVLDKERHNHVEDTEKSR